MLELLDIKAVCTRLGGTRPVHPSTVYRKVQDGQLPKPLKLGTVSRWRADEIDALVQRVADARDNPQLTEKTS